MSDLRLAVAATAVLAACSGDETLTAYGAADRTFRLTEIDGTPFPARATIAFPEPRRIEGEAPCNRFSGVQTVPYPWFSAEAIAATRRACPELAAEAAFFDALSAMTLAEVTGGTLILSTPEGREMVFTALPQPAAPAPR